MGKVVAMTGNIAVANAMRQVNPDVCAAYPITPSTEIMQQFASFVSDGLVDTEFVAAESEHSSMSACIGAAAAGGRVMTATSANGMALMWEMLYIAAGNRLPIVMALVNRALSAPINIHCDHSDAMGARDSGWIQLFSENAQEAYDNLIQAVCISENMQVRLPVMVCMDGFIISHSIERMELLEDAQVKEFIGEYQPHYPLLDLNHPVTYGAIDLQDYYSEHKRQESQAMEEARSVILEVSKRFGKAFGREYSYFEGYRLEDAQIAVVALGSSCGTIRAVVDELRAKGIAAGSLKLRTFRPFPFDELAQALKHVSAIAVLDRAESYGAGGPLCSEVRAALYGLAHHPQILGYVYGLGGRDFGLDAVHKVFQDLQEAQAGKIDRRFKVGYLTVRE
ncbi:MAG: pyruvate ferredoxin oxidoreductase [Candidatus Schekmanbacteria bacterium]|nr:pyruvate ferredoxin oxidoreductase [Candidatus Schekmanbacteria bacterium]